MFTSLVDEDFLIYGHSEFTSPFVSLRGLLKDKPTFSRSVSCQNCNKHHTKHVHPRDPTTSQANGECAQRHDACRQHSAWLCQRRPRPHPRPARLQRAACRSLPSPLAPRPRGAGLYQGAITCSCELSGGTALFGSRRLRLRVQQVYAVSIGHLVKETRR